MKRENRVQYSEQATEKITAVSRPHWTDDGVSMFYAIDDALANALKDQRQGIAAWLRQQGLERAADDIANHVDTRG